ncbi:FERM domain-containing protein 3 [Sarcoptes scabiei]|uniref:FERM domain-containing protein 3 n=1 Tax=Sarcoptes scabiei TaxID=52283 RepID=A0A132A8F3_SARSC|nr:FERM domain-containing protein 3 [Sarcoptes scabiei]
MASKLLSRFGSKKDLTLQQQHFDCTIKLLDDEEVVQTNFQKEQKGQFLLDYVFKMLNLLERDYFGLRFVDPNNQRVRIPFLNYLITEDNFSIDYSKVWLDPTKLIYKQVKNITPPIIFCFRVKYYPANPTTLKEELTRYYLYLQLRRDILNQKLHCLSDSTYLMACVLQSDLGDFDAQDHKGNYIASMKIKILPNQNEKIELEAIEIHQKEMKGLTPADVELLFLQRASKLDTYGIDPYPVKDQKKNQFLLGINYSGIVCFEGNKKVNHFACGRVEKELIEDMKKVPASGGTINRRHSMNMGPSMMHSVGRSNTAPLPDASPPKFQSSIYEDKKPKDLNETLQQSTACLPTEFNLRPDLTPNGQEQQTISFETPVIRSSPSQLSQTKISTGEETNNDSDETLEQVSEIVDQSISTAHHYYQQQQNQTKESINKRAVLIVLILILEIDNEFFEKIRGLPEMTLFRQEYYDPIREQVLQSYNHYRESFKIEEKR